MNVVAATFGAWWRRDRRRALLVLLAVAAVVLGGCGGWAWWSAAHDQDLSYAQQRDAVRLAGSRAAGTLYTLDYHAAGSGLANWRRVSTGALARRLAVSHDSDARAAKAAKATSTARVRDAAVTALDSHAGTAKVMAALQVTVTQNGKTSNRRSRVVLSMDRTDAGWKAASLDVFGSKP